MTEKMLKITKIEQNNPTKRDVLSRKQDFKKQIKLLIENQCFDKNIHVSIKKTMIYHNSIF